MKNYSFNLIFGTLIVLSILFGTFIWEKILPFNDNMIVGEYSDKKFNPTNILIDILLLYFYQLSFFFHKFFLESKILKILF